MSSTTPPGWYPDGQGGQRWWDGRQWAAGPPAGPPGQPPTQAWGAPQGSPYGGPAGPGYGGPPPGRGKAPIVLGVIGALVVVGLIALVLVLTLGGDDDSDGENLADNDDTSQSADPDTTDDPDDTDDTDDTDEPAPDPEPEGGTPEEAITAFLGEESCFDADAYLTDKARAERGDCGPIDEQFEETGIAFEDITWEIGDVEESGDTATVPVEFAVPDVPSYTIEYEMVREGGEWLVDDANPVLDDEPGTPGDDQPAEEGTPGGTG